MGATLAARVAARNKKTVETLVLWDPVVSGQEYVEEVLHGSGAQADAVAEAQGFPLTSSFLEELRGLELAPLVSALPTRTRIIVSAALRSHELLRSELDRHGRSEMLLEEIGALQAWLEYRDYGAGAIPTKVLDTIAEWVRQ